VSKVLITTGYPTYSSKKTEVIDLEDSEVKCKDLDVFPMEIFLGIGTNLVSMPIICGGLFYDAFTIEHSSDQCLIYKETGWQHFVTMIDRRIDAAGIVYDNAFHIFGGYDQDDNTILQSSEIINEDGSSTEGPQLPIPIFFHAIASINSTVSIITGGETNTNLYTNRTWYFNHAKQEFTPGPDLSVGRYVHASATITDQETKEKIVVVSGGYNGSFLDSTEILLNGEWVAGKNLKKS
jgi:hypothetical protein